MRTRLLALGGLAAVLGIGAAFGVSAQTPVAPGGDPSVMAAERHPELVAALRALRNAKSRLAAADRDFGGHRAKAVDHTNQAISEVEQAIAFDKH